MIDPIARAQSEAEHHDNFQRAILLRLAIALLAIVAIVAGAGLYIGVTVNGIASRQECSASVTHAVAKDIHLLVATGDRRARDYLVPAPCS